MKADPLPSLDVLHASFNYDSLAGALYWKAMPKRRVPVGQKAGTLTSNDYLQVQILGKFFKVHRIIWKMHTGIDPGLNDIDHRDTNRTNNRFENLRLATRSQNLANSNISSRNTSGIKGVCWSKIMNKWTAQIRKDGKVTNLGYYDTIEEATKVRREYAIKIHGEYARES